MFTSTIKEVSGNKMAECNEIILYHNLDDFTDLILISTQSYGAL